MTDSPSVGDTSASFSTPAPTTSADRSGVHDLRLSGGDEGTDTNGNPTLEQAKMTFKSEMASSKLRKELAALRDEKESAEEAIRQRDEKIFVLEREISRARVRDGGSGSPASKVGQSGVLTTATTLLMYSLMLFIFFLAIWHLVGLDPLGSLHSRFSMSAADAKIRRVLQAIFS